MSETRAALRSIQEIIADLSKPIPRRLLKTKTVSGQKIPFLPWHKAIKFLDLYAPGWNYEVRQVTGIGGKLILVTRISVPCAEGIVYREATGQEDEDIAGWGDSSSNAEAQSLKRAAAKFGLGLYLYEGPNQH
jgi:Rad52/22 family double-strand break repair protein